MPEGIALLTIFVLSAFTGYEVISKVSTILHTPLMSSANAISGLILVGAILIAGRADSTVELVVGLFAVALASINLVGGFVVTDRMLDMFRGRRSPVAAAAGASGAAAGAVVSEPETPSVQGETKTSSVYDLEDQNDTDDEDSEFIDYAGGSDDVDEQGQSGAERHG